MTEWKFAVRNSSQQTIRIMAKTLESKTKLNPNLPLEIGPDKDTCLIFSTTDPIASSQGGGIKYATLSAGETFTSYFYVFHGGNVGLSNLNYEDAKRRAETREAIINVGNILRVVASCDSSNEGVIDIKDAK